MAETSRHNKKMKDLVTSEILVTVIEDWKLQCVNNAADSVNDAACQKPSKCSRTESIDNLTVSEDAGPSHSDIEKRRYPFRTEYPERLENDSDCGNGPDERQQDNAGVLVEYKKTDWCVASGNQYKDHHVIPFFHEQYLLFQKY